MRRPILPPLPASTFFWALGAAVPALSRGTTMGCVPVETGPRARPPNSGNYANTDEAACPRHAERDARNRCRCDDADFLVLGACVPPEVGDRYCGRDASITRAGCVYLACASGDGLESQRGACQKERSAGLRERDSCPRGASLSGRACVAQPSCPPGALLDGAACRAVVYVEEAGARGQGRLSRATRVDVGAWAALALGRDGGGGSSALCRPIEQRPELFVFHERKAPGVDPHPKGEEKERDSADPDEDLSLDEPRQPLPLRTPPLENAPAYGRVVRLRIALRLPDVDVTRVTVVTSVRDESGTLLAPPDGQGAASEAVSTLVELLRSLGGEATAAAVDLEVRCVL